MHYCNYYYCYFIQHTNKRCSGEGKTTHLATYSASFSYSMVTLYVFTVAVVNPLYSYIGVVDIHDPHLQLGSNKHALFYITYTQQAAIFICLYNSSVLQVAKTGAS